MSPNELFEKIRERLAKADPNNRKVVAIFQIKSGDLNWGEFDILVNVICKGFNSIVVFTVIDLKELKVYEGTADNPDTTIISDLPTFIQLMKKEITMEEAQAQVSWVYFYEEGIINTYSISLQGKLSVEGNIELLLKAQTA